MSIKNFVTLYDLENDIKKVFNKHPIEIGFVTDHNREETLAGYDGVSYEDGQVIIFADNNRDYDIVKLSELLKDIQLSIPNDMDDTNDIHIVFKMYCTDTLYYGEYDGCYLDDNNIVRIVITDTELE